MAGSASRRRIFLAVGLVNLLVVACAPGSAVRSGPTRYEIYLKRGDGFYFNDRYGEAVAEYTKAAELDAGRAEAYRFRGYAFMSLEDHERARADFQRAIELSPEYAEAHLGLGILLYRLGRYPEAIETLTLATALDPWDSTARYYTALACEKIGRLREAVEAYKGYIHCVVPRDAEATRFVRERIKALEGSLR